MITRSIVCYFASMEEERIFDMSHEEWRDVVGYDGYYKVSNYGRVKVLPHIVNRGFCMVTCQEKILKPRIKNNKYLFVRLSNGSKRTSKEKYVHRLVAQAFLPNPEKKSEIDHIDGDKINNIVTNLKWATRMENVHNPNTICKNTALKVSIMSRDGMYYKEFSSLTSASKELGVPLSTLSWAKGEQKKNNNSTYKYIVKEI